MTSLVRLIIFCLVVFITREIYSDQNYLGSAYTTELKASNAPATKVYKSFRKKDSTNSSRINTNFDNRSKLILANKISRAVGSINSSLNSRDNFNITIIGQLGGEIGNHLSYILGMYTVSHRLKEKFNITSHIRFRHQDRRKWVNGYNSMQSCFPKFRGVDFSFFNSPNFKPLMDSQPISPMEDPDEIVRFALDHSSTFRSSTGTHPSSPFIYLKNAMVSSNDIKKAQIIRFQNLFQFDMDNPKCCNPDMSPYANETVFHFRNFKREMPRRYKSLCFAEMGANETFIELFSDAKFGDNVAMTKRPKILQMS
ncbi:hypothetical protein CTEN210_06953 [Chaetoceros tenuissimus]|uniref:Uncharacterized protein n=1 Tax=Chaetoceros tenuissimus TaxID=426638 RepID=A0AAD3H4N9_9STRA|nr:hypothetical protein CTEN210_06953 [Chaetoceros tenuissimus]